MYSVELLFIPSDSSPDHQTSPETRTSGTYLLTLIDGQNYLLPVKADIRDKVDVEFEAVNANRILAQMEDAGSGVGIVILDACRNTPFRDFRGVGDGLAAKALRGSFIAYATAPGGVATDGAGRNGIYTKHILKNLTRQGLTVEEIFRDARAGVVQETGGAQVPWDSSSLARKVYLAEAPEEKPVPAPAKETPSPSRDRPRCPRFPESPMSARLARAS